MMVSFAQNHEDVLLDRLFPRDHRGLYVDVGANHPAHCSVTKHFYDLGWSGINIEPSSVFEQLAARRPRDVNLRVAVSDHDGEADFYEFPGRTTDSTLSAPVAEGNRRPDGRCVVKRVPVRTLASVCREHVGQRTIDFLSVDVEGHEEAVLRGADWSRWRPRVVVVEATRPHSTEQGDAVWEPILLASGYLFAAFDGLNRFYVREEDRPLLALLRAPVCIFDDFFSVVHGIHRRAQWITETPHAETVELLRGLVPTGSRVLMGLFRCELKLRFRRLAGLFDRAKRALGRRAA